jgi:hypothetical protein
VSRRSSNGPNGSVASFGTEQEFAEKASFPGNSAGHLEEFVDSEVATQPQEALDQLQAAIANREMDIVALGADHLRRPA